MPRVFEENRLNGVNKRYEVDTADTETSFGYKFMRKSPSNDNQSNISLGPHNGKLFHL